MKRILIAVAALGVAAAIAVGTQRSLPRTDEAAAALPAPSALSESPAAAAGPAGTDTPGAEQDARGADAGADAQPPADPAAPEADEAPLTAPPVPTAAPAATEQARGLSSPRPATQATSPEEILERAAEAYAAVRTMQADFRMAVTNPLLRRTTNSAGTLYQQRPDRIALRFSDPAGDAIVGDGTWFWVYYPSVNPDQVIRMPASEGTTGGVDLQAQFLGNPVERFDATLHGSERVGGRETHVLTMVPRTPAGYTSLKVWLDTSDSLARRFEITEENGTVRRFELTNLRTNVAIADDVFRFTPPAGARVIERS